MKTAVLISVVCLLLSFPAAAQLCPGGGLAFSSSVTFDPAWIYGCNTGTSCNGGVALDNKLACQPTTALDACAPAPSCGTFSESASNVWFRFYAAGTTATISCFQNSSFVIGIQAFSGGPACGALTNLGCALAGGPSSGVQLPLSGLTPGALYYFRIYGSSTPLSQRSGIYCFCGTTGLSSSILAATIRSFSGAVSGDKIVLQWQLPAGSHGMYELEHSTDGMSFTTLARIAGSAGTGAQNYDYTDASPANGANYYRVKEPAPGGNTYSDIILVKAGLLKAVSLQVIPGRRELQVSVNTATSAILYDTGGRPLESIHLQAGTHIIPLGQLPAGVYFLRSDRGGAQKFYLPR